MAIRRDQFKSSYGAFTSRERDLARSRALRDARDAAEARVADPTATREAPVTGGLAGAAAMASRRVRG
jgi:hypothetical protein